MSSIISLISFQNYVYDFINFLFLISYFLCFAFYFNGKQYKLSAKETLIFIFFLITPFFFNNLIINWWTFPDQSKYLNAAIAFRSLENIETWYQGVYHSSLLYSLFPIPFLYTFISISLINRFIFLCIIYYLYKKKNFSNKLLIIFLIIPSLTLYTSIGLRETLVYFMSFLVCISLNNRNFFLLIIKIIIIYLLSKKFGILVALSSLSYYVLFNVNFKLRFIFITLSLACVLYFLIFFDLNKILNEISYGYFSENNKVSNIILSDYRKTSVLEFILNTPIYFIKAIFKFIHLLNGYDFKSFTYFTFYLLEFASFCYLFNQLIRRKLKANYLKIFFIFIFFYFTTSFLGFSVDNINTLFRYKLIIFVYTFFMLYFLKEKNNEK